MALTVKQLNADASFLLSLEPVLPAPRDPSLQTMKPFTILLDPWLDGSSTILHPKVSFTKLRSPACVATLDELPEPDLVIVSQHRSDHCNGPTLRQLPGRDSGSKTIILAEAGAARVIRGWKHFDQDKVRSLERWDKLRPQDTVTKISVPPVVEGGTPGEVTVAFVAQKRDMTGLHGAVGITYRPPGLVPSVQNWASKLDTVATWAQPPQGGINNGALTPQATSKTPRSPFNLPNLSSSFLNPPTVSSRDKVGLNRLNSSIGIPREDAKNTENGNGSTPLVAGTAKSSLRATGTDLPPRTPTSMAVPPMPTSPPPPPPPSVQGQGRVSRIPSPLRAIRSLSTIASSSSSPVPSPLSSSLTTMTSMPTSTTGPPSFTPPKSPSTVPPRPRPTTPFSSRTLSTIMTLASRPGAGTYGLNRPVSVIFSPHGTAVAELEDFTTHHLIPRAAVPLTLLMHCFDRARNPWFLGGEISMGAQSGALAAARLGARCWVSAHDGDKVIRGMVTKGLKIRRWGITEIEGVVCGMEMAVEMERKEGTGRIVNSSTEKERDVEGEREKRKMRVSPNIVAAISSTSTETKRWWTRSVARKGLRSRDRFTSRGEDISGDGNLDQVDGYDGRYKIATPRRCRLRTRVMALGLGEEVILTSEGVWDAEDTPRRKPSLKLDIGQNSADSQE